MGSILDKINFDGIIGKKEPSPTRSLGETNLDFQNADDWNFATSSLPGHITNETALKFSAVWSAVRILSEVPASLPRDVMVLSGKNRIPNHNDPVCELLNNPNKFMTGFDFHEVMNGSLQIRGNALALITTDRRGFPVELLPINWLNVIVRLKDGVILYDIKDPVWNIYKTVTQDEVLHYKLFSSDGLIGRSPITMARNNISLALSAEAYGKEFFDRGGNHKAVIETEKDFKSYTEYAKWRSQYESEHTGRGRNHDVPILQPGMKFHQLTMSMEDAQFIATRQFSLQDISRWFNIPPHFLAELSKATFSNIEHQDLQFIKYSLRGVIKRQEEEWDRKLFTPQARKTSGVKFDLDGLARGDMAARSTYIVNMVNAGVMTPNEGRQIENLPSISGNDDLRIPANITGNIQQNPSNGK